MRDRSETEDRKGSRNATEHTSAGPVMVDVGDKAITARSAIADGYVRISADLARHIREQNLPKGPVLAVAQLAGIMGAKRTPDLIPLCHPVPLDAVDVDVRLEDSRIVVTASVRAHGRTGVEMEALTAVAVACLTIVDMGKSIDREMVIEGIRLVEKHGGRSGSYVAGTGATPAGSTDRAGQADVPQRSSTSIPIRAAVLTVSDRCARGERVDESGPALLRLLGGRLGAAVVAAACVPDDEAQIVERLRAWSAADAGIDLIVATGGTGLSPRDRTPEAALRVIERRHDALMELARLRCLGRTPLAYASRGVAGVAGRTLILTLPGAPRGACEMLEALADVLPHALAMLRDQTDHTLSVARPTSAPVEAPGPSCPAGDPCRR